MNIKGAIFDLDGTLLDSMFIWDTIGSEYLISRGILPEKGLNAKFKTMSIVQAAEYYQERYGITDSIEDIISGVNSMIEHYYSDIVPAKPGVEALLKKLESRGVKMCVATATDRYMVEAALKRTGLDSFFCGVFTCTEVGSGKDCPEIFEKALETLQTRRDETIVFEDALYAVKTAKKAGFHVAAVYDKSSEAEQEEIKKLSDFYITSYEDWSEML